MKLSSLLSRVQSGIWERKIPISGFDIHGGLGGGDLEGGGMLVSWVRRGISDKETRPSFDDSETSSDLEEEYIYEGGGAFWPKDPRKYTGYVSTVYFFQD